MLNLPGNGHTPTEPRDRRGENVGGGKAKRSYPTPAEMFFRIGATIFVAICVGVAIDFLVKAVTH